MEVISEQTRNESASLQLLNDVSSVVKELVENSLDANATQIDISLIEEGCESIEVTDNGSGIKEEDFELLATRNATSKISRIEDLNTKLNTFGFRGEALNSIAILSILNVKTRTRDSNDGWSLTFDSQGRLTSKTKCIMNYGTIVTSSNLFYVFPVRRTQLTKGWNNKIKSIVDLVQQYALINPNVRITLTNKPESGKITPLFSSPGDCTSISDVVSFVYGKRIVQNMNEWEYSCQVFRIAGIISDLYQVCSPSIQILYINGRPVTSQKSICTAIINVYKHYYYKAKPSFILNLILNLGEIDVNCSPDKRTIYITIEEFIITKIKVKLHEFFETLGINSRSEDFSQTIADLSQREVQQKHSLENDSESLNPTSVGEILQTNQRELGEDASQNYGNFNLKRYKVDCCVEYQSNKSEEIFGFNIKGNDNKSEINLSQLNYTIERVLNLDINQYIASREREKTLVNPENTIETSKLLQDPKRIDKGAFKKMEICGQFNKGFIITKLASCNENDIFKYSLYILDQHAADEKARFESLNKKIKINCQKLIKPAFIRVPPSHLAVALDNENILECNGFKIVGSNDSGLFIATFPTIFSHVLGEGDFLEFLEKISAANTVCESEANNTREYMWEYFQSIPRPPRIWSILAGTACKSAVKIGDDLDRRKMECIKNTLSDLDHPWNCPHGRPTIKCLATAAELTAVVQNVPCQLDFN